MASENKALTTHVNWAILAQYGLVVPAPVTEAYPLLYAFAVQDVRHMRPQRRGKTVFIDSMLQREAAARTFSAPADVATTLSYDTLKTACDKIEVHRNFFGSMTDLPNKPGMPLLEAVPEKP